MPTSSENHAAHLDIDDARDRWVTFRRQCLEANATVTWAHLMAQRHRPHHDRRRRRLRQRARRGRHMDASDRDIGDARRGGSTELSTTSRAGEDGGYSKFSARGRHRVGATYCDDDARQQPDADRRSRDLLGKTTIDLASRNGPPCNASLDAGMHTQGHCRGAGGTTNAATTPCRRRSSSPAMECAQIMAERLFQDEGHSIASTTSVSIGEA